MKKTVWEIDQETCLHYHHANEEMWISQDTRGSTSGKLHEVLLATPEYVSQLMLALGELKVLLDAVEIDKASDAMGAVACVSLDKARDAIKELR